MQTLRLILFLVLAFGTMGNAGAKEVPIPGGVSPDGKLELYFEGDESNAESSYHIVLRERQSGKHLMEDATPATYSNFRGLLLSMSDKMREDRKAAHDSRYPGPGPDHMILWSPDSRLAALRYRESKRTFELAMIAVRGKGQATIEILERYTMPWQTPEFSSLDLEPLQWKSSNRLLIRQRGSFESHKEDRDRFSWLFLLEISPKKPFSKVVARCDETTFSQVDFELNKVYDEIRENCGGEQKPLVTRAQRYWIAYRDAHCDCITSEPLAQARMDCLTSTTTHRVLELQSLKDSVTR